VPVTQRAGARQTSYFLLARALPALVSLASIVVYTRLLPAAEYGVLSLTVVIGTCANLALFHWVQAGIQRLYPEYEMRGRSEHVLRVVVGGYVAYLGIALAVVGVTMASSVLSEFRMQVILACAAFTMLLPAFESNLALAIAHSDSLRYGLLAGVRATIGLATGIILVLLLGPLGENAVWGLCMGLVVATVFFGYGIWFRGRWEPATGIGTVKELLEYGGPMSLALLFSFLATSADRLIIGAFLGVNAVGLYVAGYDLVHQAIGAIMGTISMAAAPSVYRTHAAGNSAQSETRLRDLLFFQVSIGLPLVVLLVLAAPRISAMLLGKDYANASAVVVQLIAISAFLNNIRAFYFDMAFHIALRTDLILKILGVVATVNVVANLILLPRYGIVAAGVSAILSYAIGLVLSILLGRKVHAIPLWPAKFMQILLAAALMLVLYIAMETNLRSLHWITHVVLAAGAYACLVAFALRSGAPSSTGH
jgi:O-antigen/teichoic acid export membrane protein